MKPHLSLEARPALDPRGVEALAKLIRLDEMGAEFCERHPFDDLKWYKAEYEAQACRLLFAYFGAIDG